MHGDPSLLVFVFSQFFPLSIVIGSSFYLAASPPPAAVPHALVRGVLYLVLEPMCAECGRAFVFCSCCVHHVLGVCTRAPGTRYDREVLLPKVWLVCCEVRAERVRDLGLSRSPPLFLALPPTPSPRPADFSARDARRMVYAFGSAQGT